MYAVFDRVGMLTNAVWNGSLRVAGDFRGEYLDVFGVSVTAPVLTLPKGDLHNAAEGDTIEIGDVSYVVAELRRADHDEEMHLILRVA